ncbi:MAG: tRNA uridine-5-carboxymethylaminomethyl(34) synthesis enzyme MnmG [Omnitrophica WOR_2 bacterium GWA2_47_8]|nr:MAG: tRNA uridine-5-carboxymethylaminomethyl(34) synthesis enzyme MnmG [Omnitrophica WOR_2 bacterium GWA2_47_8]
MSKTFDCIVIGAGHAGVEAALAASRMGCKTLMITLFFETIGQMSCNPAIGGVGKGQLVKEIDALGGEMGLAADRTGIQFRQLNASKGQAVRSSRCQSDRKQYKRYMQNVVSHQPNLTILIDEVSEMLTRNGKIIGVKTVKGEHIETQTIIVTTGTFLKGRIHVGTSITSGGRVGEPASIRLADNFKDLGFEVLLFKTGTPPRLDGRTIDFSKMEVQHSDDPPLPFSFRTPFIPKEQKLLPCHITRTTEETHTIIRNNLHLSPMYSGRIQATGVRYCPSIEDKIKKFSDKKSHHVFLEPEGLDTDEYYPNGISTGLPADVQEQMVHSIPGMEKTIIVRPGYSIEHGVIPATELRPTLETKKVSGLFLAGQINGTTGYEEAGAQGLIAGINAALKVKNQEPLILGRHESYIGVLIDDLTTKGTDEPYRMFTSRVEYRLIIREDNADRRLVHYGHKFGLLKDEDYAKIEKKYTLIDREIEHLRATRIYPGTDLDQELERISSAPIRQPLSLAELLRRPEINYQIIAPYDGDLKNFPQNVIDQVEYEIKYEGFIKKQMKTIERFRHIENIKVPADIDYDVIGGLSTEIKEKLKRFSPISLGQANRISGVTLSAITILMVHLKRLSYDRNKDLRS